MKYNWQELKKLWIAGSTGQKDGKFPREVAMKIDKFIVGFEKEVNKRLTDEHNLCFECELTELCSQALSSDGWCNAFALIKEILGQ